MEMEMKMGVTWYEGHGYDILTAIDGSAFVYRIGVIGYKIPNIKCHNCTKTIQYKFFTLNPQVED